MSPQEFDRLWSTRIEPDGRLISLGDKLREYYLATNDCSDQEASRRWRELKSWAYNSGYSAYEINQQKMVILRELNI